MARGELQKVSSLFDKYKKTLVAPERVVVQEFVGLVEDMFKVRVAGAQVSYNPTTRALGVRGVSALKSEIRLHEAEILAHLRARLGDKNAPKRFV